MFTANVRGINIMTGSPANAVKAGALRYILLLIRSHSTNFFTNIGHYNLEKSKCL